MSILPFPSFLDDVKEKGFKKAIFEGIDVSMERLTAGMNVQDVREALRGETPSRRPNPRLTPHADGFLAAHAAVLFQSRCDGHVSVLAAGLVVVIFCVFRDHHRYSFDALVYAVAGNRLR